MLKGRRSFARHGARWEAWDWEAMHLSPHIVLHRNSRTPIAKLPTSYPRKGARTRGWRGGSIIRPCVWVDFQGYREKESRMKHKVMSDIIGYFFESANSIAVLLSKPITSGGSCSVWNESEKSWPAYTLLSFIWTFGFLCSGSEPFLLLHSCLRRTLHVGCVIRGILSRGEAFKAEMSFPPKSFFLVKIT